MSETRVGSESLGVALLVEDERAVRVAMSRMLGRLGWEVIAAAGGAEALAILESREDIAVVISDLKMPCMSGLELFGIIGERFAARSLAKILCTGDPSEIKWETLSADVRITVLEKPFGAASIVSALADASHPS